VTTAAPYYRSPKARSSLSSEITRRTRGEAPITSTEPSSSPGPATGREQHVDARAVHEGHAREVQGQLRTVPAYHPEEFVSQSRSGEDIDLAADLDDQRQVGERGYLQPRCPGAVRGVRLWAGQGIWHGGS
jgi:hypothetical protein